MVGEFGLLIYDEPTAALDPIAEANLNSIIFAEDNRATTVLISHRLTNVVNADYIYVMKEGRIAEEGTHASLMEQQGYYHEMFTLQAKNYIATSEEVRINLQSYKNVKCPQKKELGNLFFFSTISDILILEYL